MEADEAGHAMPEPREGLLPLTSLAKFFIYEESSTKVEDVVLESEGGATEGEGAEGEEIGESPEAVVRYDKRNWCFGKQGWINFSQQKMRGWRPIVTPLFAISTMLFLTAVFVPIGVISLIESRNVVEVKARYDKICESGSSNEEREQSLFNSLALPGGVPDCLVDLEVDTEMEGDVYVYFEMRNQFQNVRRYVTSVSYSQLRGKDEKPSSLNQCKPEKYLGREQNSSLVDDGLVNPCGLIAWSFQNDTIGISVGGNSVFVNDNDIAWPQDVKRLIGDYDTVNFNTEPRYRGGGEVTVPLNQDQHFLVWLRLGPRSVFRKLYGVIDKSSLPFGRIAAGTTVTAVIQNQYNSYNFDGEKYVVISTLSFLGGRNDFLGIFFLVMASLYALTAAVVLVITLLKRRPVGDLEYLSWNRKEHRTRVLVEAEKD